MSWKAEYIILILFSTILDYFVAIKLHESKKDHIRKMLLSVSVASNLFLLFLFKYFNFFSESFRTLLEAYTIQLNPMTLNVLLPVGISFYTFQTMSYTIDIYKRKIKPEYHFGVFAVYVSFFPQLVAGPIERAKNLLPQFHLPQLFEYNRVTDGLKLCLWGFFKKIVIADRLAIYVDIVFNNVTDHTGLSLILAAIFFAFQIYCDFSGYSDIAIGCAQIMGISLMNNFDRPYGATSLTNFWQRWHISLSTWFRDYVYIPIGGSRVNQVRWISNILVVFVVSGLWHGANWTFIVWGAYHGLVLIAEKYLTPILRPSARKLFGQGLTLHCVQVVFTFILATIGWIFFRANTLSDAMYIFRNLFQITTWSVPALEMGLSWSGLGICAFLIFFLEYVHSIESHQGMRHFLNKKPQYQRWTVYLVLILCILLLGVFNKTEFIYFQF